LSYKLKNLKKVENNKVILDLEITNNYLKKSINAAYQDISEKAKIPGFRKGKIPYNIIDINFGKKYVLNEAATIAISELYPKIIEDSNLKPIDYPKVKINQIEEGRSLDFEITVEVEPEIQLPGYKGIEVTGISEEVSDDEIQKQIDNLRSNYATLEPVEDNKTISRGDFVILDFDGKIDGRDFEGNSAQDYTLEVGSRTLFEEFEDALLGMKQGEKKEIKLTLPDSIANKDLVGKVADFSINIKELKRKVLPEIDEEFLKNLGEYKNLDEFKEYLKGRIKEQKQKIRRDRMITDIIKNLVENSKFDAPEPMINNRVRHVLEEFEKDLKENKVNRSDYLKSINLTEEQFRNDIKQSAALEIKEYLIFNALEKAEAEIIEPTAEEIETETSRILNTYKKEEDKVKIQDFLGSTEGKNELLVSLRRKNLFDFLIKNARITEEKDLKSKSSDKKLWTPKDKDKDIEKDKVVKSQSKEKEKKLWIPNQTNKQESGDKK
jgi:trigger factor